MAQRENQVNRDKLCCSICLDLLKDPVTIPCGHSYCMNCVKSYWDEEDQKETHSCPQCRQAFTPRPALVRNTVIADLVEETKKTGLQAAKADLCHAEHEDVSCDFCTETKLKAVKSCLQCLVSYCEQHLQPHYEAAALKKHKLVDPSQKLQEIMCPRHNEVMKIFCRTDQQCICYLCSMDEHKGHDTVSTTAEMNEKQRELKERQKNIERKIKEKEKSLKVLQQEISELRRRKAELEQLSHTEDPTQFLHNYTLLSRLSEAPDSASINIHPERYTEDVAAAVSETREKLQDNVEWTITAVEETKGDVSLSETEPKTRAEFLKYKCEITFNPNTAHQRVVLEPGLKAKYSHTQTIRRYDHADRFTDWPQVLSREIFTGPCYWEVEWSGDDVFIALADSSVSRSGKESAFGNNKISWALECFSGGYTFRDSGNSTFIKGPQSSRIGVFLNHFNSYTYLSFYSVSESTRTMTLLHRVQTRCPLLVGLSVYGGSAEICEISS
ncbi:tripartite motif-containing protein 16-like [Pundamilia nyererei]|uniref:Tripartite motif-containing protein 16-like n=1 Tax=Pundamilia nyererei TaxID=303518 RepID=A0A9Y3V801_9CICH|nr:PREDICTED: tripartite motif-containing protein 16-like [Pundamilia nyererei]